MSKTERNGWPEWPVVRQIRQGDVLAWDGVAASPRSEDLRARTVDADKVVSSVCPYCGVGCGQLVYVKDEKIIDIEGDPRSPISEGCLCPKGAASKNYVTGPLREYKVKYRRPYGREWEELPLEQAMDMIADRVIEARDRHWDEEHKRTLAIGNLGGATLDNEENYLIKKLFNGLGIVQIENQARI